MKVRNLGKKARTSLIKPVLEENETNQYDQDFFGMPSIPEENLKPKEEESKEPSGTPLTTEAP